METDQDLYDEYRRFSDAYDPRDRVAECPDEDATMMVRLEVDFALPVLMTQEQQGRLLKLIDEITDSPWNAPAGGVHWMAGVGSKPNWSRADAMLLGVEAGADSPAIGEPTFDDSVYHVETCARAFVSEKERRRVMKRREKPKGGNP